LSRWRLTKDIRFFVSLTTALSLLAAFGCAPKTVRIYDSAPAARMSGDIVRYAVTLLGKPYKNAAKGPDAFDCSGFVYYVYGRFGMAVPVSTEGLDTIGYEIGRGDVASGDLVVFLIKRERHVGIMINRLDFIHASKSRGITVDSVEAAYWKHNFSHFRRILWGRSGNERYGAAPVGGLSPG
jgi:cell wall-associated NlpC family hydrolase